jgi:hypothetical protein
MDVREVSNCEPNAKTVFGPMRGADAGQKAWKRRNVFAVRMIDQ